jgi:hypothetical protein
MSSSGKCKNLLLPNSKEVSDAKFPNSLGKVFNWFLDKSSLTKFLHCNTKLGIFFSWQSRKVNELILLQNFAFVKTDSGINFSKEVDRVKCPDLILDKSNSRASSSGKYLNKKGSITRNLAA